MSKFTPNEVLDLCIKAIQPHRGPTAKKRNLILREGKILCLPKDDHKKADAVLLTITTKDFNMGITSNDWDKICRKIDKLIEEIVS